MYNRIFSYFTKKDLARQQKRVKRKSYKYLFSCCVSAPSSYGLPRLACGLGGGGQIQYVHKSQIIKLGTDSPRFSNHSVSRVIKEVKCLLR